MIARTRQVKATSKVALQETQRKSKKVLAAESPPAAQSFIDRLVSVVVDVSIGRVDANSCPQLVDWILFFHQNFVQPSASQAAEQPRKKEHATSTPFWKKVQVLAATKCAGLDATIWTTDMDELAKVLAVPITNMSKALVPGRNRRRDVPGGTRMPSR